MVKKILGKWLCDHPGQCTDHTNILNSTWPVLKLDIGKISLWLICLHVGNDHIGICDIKYSPKNESKTTSNYVLIDTSG